MIPKSENITISEITPKVLMIFVIYIQLYLFVFFLVVNPNWMDTLTIKTGYLLNSKGAELGNHRLNVTLLFILLVL